MLAIYKALKHFHQIIFGSKIEIKTDHANLLHQSGDWSKRINKWKVLLMEYDYTLQYQKGTKNIPADFLSRLYSGRMLTQKGCWDLKEISLNYNSSELSKFEKKVKGNMTS